VDIAIAIVAGRGTSGRQGSLCRQGWNLLHSFAGRNILHGVEWSRKCRARNGRYLHPTRQNGHIHRFGIGREDSPGREKRNKNHHLLFGD